MEIKISNLSLSMIDDVKEFTDQYIGKDYYQVSDLIEIYEKSLLNNQNCSFILFENNEIKGIRLAYMPGKWVDTKGTGGLTSNLWQGLKLSDLGYFQSLFLSSDYIGKGWAPILAGLSIDAIKKAGGLGILTHSWLESPNNSSRKYLEKTGFVLINSHKNYWINVDYVCPRCGKPCVCTAGEMLLTFKGES